MSFNPMTDPVTKQPKTAKDGVTPLRQNFFAVAVPKNGAADWKTTVWGQQIVQVAQSSYTNGETMRPDFAWKIEDGDSAIPNKAGRKNCESEGWPGHFVVKLSSTLKPTPCYHKGQYDPMQQIQSEDEVKTGFYCRVAFSVAANGTSQKPSQSPGVYINPEGFELTRPGEIIVTGSSFNAAGVFGGGQAAAPVAAPLPPVPAGPPTPSAPPAPDFLQGGAAPPAPPMPPAPSAEPKFNVGGNVYTKGQLLAAGYTEGDLAGLQKA